MDIGAPLTECAYDPEDRLAGLISPPKLFALRRCNRRITSGSHAKHLLALDYLECFADLLRPPFRSRRISIRSSIRLVDSGAPSGAGAVPMRVGISWRKFLAWA